MSAITGLAHTAAGLWAVGYVDSGCGEGTCTASWAALWNGTAWTEVPAGGGTGLSGVVAAGSQVLVTSGAGVIRLTRSGAAAQVTPAINPLELTAVGTDPAGNPWAVGWTAAQGTVNAGDHQRARHRTRRHHRDHRRLSRDGDLGRPGDRAGSTDQSGRFAVGGLPDGSYTVTASLPGCQPGVATATVTAGKATAVNAHITCPP